MLYRFNTTDGTSMEIVIETTEKSQPHVIFYALDCGQGKAGGADAPSQANSNQTLADVLARATWRTPGAVPGFVRDMAQKLAKSVNIPLTGEWKVSDHAFHPAPAPAGT